VTPASQEAAAHKIRRGSLRLSKCDALTPRGSFWALRPAGLHGAVSCADRPTRPFTVFAWLLPVAVRFRPHTGQLALAPRTVSMRGEACPHNAVSLHGLRGRPRRSPCCCPQTCESDPPRPGLHRTQIHFPFFSPPRFCFHTRGLSFFFFSHGTQLHVRRDIPRPPAPSAANVWFRARRSESERRLLHGRGKRSPP